MYTKCIPHFDKLLFNFVYKIKRTIAAKFCSYTKCIQKFVEMWDTYFVYKHFIYINSDLQKVYYIIKIMYAICIQNSYRMYSYTNNCMQNGSQFQYILHRLFYTS